MRRNSLAASLATPLNLISTCSGLRSPSFRISTLLQRHHSCSPGGRSRGGCPLHTGRYLIRFNERKQMQQESNSMAEPKDPKADNEVPKNSRSRYALSLDTWAVLLALGAAVLVRLHVITTVKW